VPDAQAKAEKEKWKKANRDATVKEMKKSKGSQGGIMNC
jgi:hypothetical protein